MSGNSHQRRIARRERQLLVRIAGSIWEARQRYFAEVDVLHQDIQERTIEAFEEAGRRILEDK